MGRRTAPEVNAGSMADIAFLLLIFFLVTTTIEKDSGIPRRLPPLEEDEQDKEVIIKEKNIFQVTLNKSNQILLTAFGEDNIVELKELRGLAVKFIDNGAGIGNPAPGEAQGTRCDYCQGEKNPQSSDHPNKAIISLQHDGETEYKPYIQVQNELVAAYNVLRNREAQRLYRRDYVDMAKELAENPYADDREELKDKVDRIKKFYPLLLSEAEAKNN
ncbi:MAG: biopolymer transporter ExbD [Flavobacteriaceae bacterium]|nr:biopolymer transporter ExbD [Flavobacteriaceae bacterium]